MSDAIPPFIPITDRNRMLVREFFESTTPLAAIALATLTWRVYSKLRSTNRMGWDDCLIVLGFAFALTDWIVLLIPFTAFVGPHPIYFMSIPVLEFGWKMAVIGVIIWACAMACIKASVALTLLRFLTARGWRVLLWTIIVMQALLVITTVTFICTQCRPIEEAWTFIKSTQACMNPIAVRRVSTAISGFNMAFDIILSFMPLAFLVRLHRPLRERILLIILMATGLMATIASIRKTTIVLKYGNANENKMDMNIAIPTWTCAEEFIGVIAACMPTLKPLIQQWLTKIGIPLDTAPGHSKGSWGASSHSHTTTDARSVKADSQDPMLDLNAHVDRVPTGWFGAPQDKK